MDGTTALLIHVIFAQRPQLCQVHFIVGKKSMDNTIHLMLRNPIQKLASIGGDLLGSVVKKRRKKMRKHKHRKLLAKTRHQRRKR